MSLSVQRLLYSHEVDGFKPTEQRPKDFSIWFSRFVFLTAGTSSSLSSFASKRKEEKGITLRIGCAPDTLTPIILCCTSCAYTQVIKLFTAFYSR